MLKSKNWIIDGNGIFMRYFFAIEETFNASGIPIHGFIGFCRCLLGVVSRHKPSSILITFDKCYNNFRKKIDPNYKSNRKKLDSSAIDQINLTIEFCKILGIQVEFHSDYEADDLIASYIHQNSDKDLNFIIMSTDKDLCQLLDTKNKTLLFNPFSKTNITQYEDVITKYGVSPEDFILFQALQGDGSDHVKGVKNIGPITAAKILKITKNIDEIKNKFTKFDFTNFEQQIQLVTLCKNVTLQNKSPQSLNLNKRAGFQFLSDMGINNELQSILIRC